MPISINAFDIARKNLQQNPFANESYVYVAQLVSDGYTFNATHTTRADLNGLVGEPLVLTGKSISYTGDNTFLDCDDLDFKTAQGTLDAAYCVINIMPSGGALPDDRLVACLTLNGGQAESVSAPIQLSSCGLLAIQREQ